MTAQKKVLIPLSLLLIIWAGSLLFIGFQVERTQTGLLLSLYGLAFIAYLVLVLKYNNAAFKMILLTAVLVRVALVFAFPKLSDDIYRFVWDGRCWYYGIHAFSYTPAEILKLYPDLKGLNIELYQQLNSQSHYSVYPAVCQLIFYISVLICPESVVGSAILIKLCLLAIELTGLYYFIKLLDYHQWKRNRLFIYALNPLVVIEIFGNAHFEGAMISFLVIALYYLIAAKGVIKSALYWSLSIASKMLSAIFLPVWLFRENNKQGIKLYSWIIIFSVPLWFIILLNTNIFNSLNLYFQNFEFNASVYYIFRWIGTAIKGYNPIHTVGPFLSICTLVICLLIAWKKRLDQLPYQAMLFMFSCYLLLATTVHPWYLIMLVLLSCFTGYLYPIIWSAMVILTYANYKIGAYHEELILVGIEYVITISIMLYELFRKPILSTTQLFQLRQ